MFEGEDEFGSAGEFVVLVIADQGLVNLEMREKFLRVARVFAGDLVDFLEDAKSAKSDVFEVADRSADEIEAAEGAGGSVGFVEVGVIGGIRVHEASVACGERETVWRGM